jgi:serine/threonine-protein kinase
LALTPGTRLGVYDITAQIGEGGMGQVYRATDTKLKRQVAIKILPASVAADADRLARFQREAEVLASLNHPNIAAIYGLEESRSGGSSDPPVTALVMELVEGEDLSELIARHASAAPRGGGAPRGLSIEDALPIAKQIADALEAAHEQGIIHRDLKPANIKLRADGIVKVLDFGLAKAMDPVAQAFRPAGGAGSPEGLRYESPTLTTPAMTLQGVILGTAAYMAPEQAKGKSVDKRADIWAFGVVLYEILTGTRGYAAEDVSDTLAAVLTREVDWTKLPSTTPPRIVALLRDCLVRDPKQRLRDMGEARRVLDQLITGASSSSMIAPAVDGPRLPTPDSRLSTWQRTPPWVIAVLATAVAAGATWRLATLKAVASPVTRSRATFKETTVFVDVSRDGSKVAYARAGEQGLHLEVRHVDQFDGLALPGTDGVQVSVFSPAGDWIAFGTGDTRIKKTPSTGGPVVTLTDGSFNNGAAWGDDDTIVFGTAAGLMRVPASGGAAEPLTKVDKDKKEVRHLRPQFLPGGQQLLFTVTYDSADPQFAVLDLKKGGYKAVARGGDNARYVPTGHLLSMRAGTLFALPFDLGRLTATGPEAPVIEGVSNIGPVGTADYAVSQDGLLVYFESLSAGGTRLTWRDRRGVETPLAGQSLRSWGTGSLSPDGLRMANAILEAKNSDIWVVDLARGTPTRLTFGGTNDNPIWTPDGRTIVYGGTKDGKPGLYKVPADGSGQAQLILATAEPLPSSFAPDGKTLVFHQPGPSGRPRIMVLPLDAAGTPTPHPLREGAASDWDAHVSPDGKWVAFASTESGRPEVYVLPFPGPGAKFQISADGMWRPRWSASGRELFFWTTSNSSATLYSSTIQPSPFMSSAPQKLFAMLSGTTWGVAPDGQHFLVEAVQSGGTLVTVTNWFDELRRRAPAKK